MPDSLDLVAPLDFYVVDVFTDVAHGGNPLAVVLDAEGLDTAQLQVLAKEFNLSETAFPLRVDDGTVDYELRIFTPTLELPFAGHPSVGAAWLMAALGRIPAGRVVQRCGAGDLPLGVAAERGPVELTGGRPRVSATLDTAAYARAVGVAAADVCAPVLAAGTGIDWAYVQLGSRAAVDASLADDGLLGALQPGAAYSFCWDAATSTAYARGWAGGLGIHEDPATGAAALGLGACLVDTGLLPRDGVSAYTVVQGVAMGRPAALRGRVEARDGVAVRCAVEGDCVLVAKGQTVTPR